MRFVFGFTSLALPLAQFAVAAPTPGTRHLPRNTISASPGNASYDYVVIGGGAAGLAIAARLSENPFISVAVIEAGTYYELSGNYSEIPIFDSVWTGKDPADTNPAIDWDFVTVPQVGALNASIHYARGKCFGGSSARNYMGYLTSTRAAYAKWANLVGDQGYTFDNLEPFFQKSLNFTPPDMTRRAANATPAYDLSTFGKGGGPVSVTFPNYAMAVSSYVQKGLLELGVKALNGLTSGKLLGSAYVLATIQTPSQERESSETAFLTPAVTRSNLMVYPLTLGKKILFNSAKHATGVIVSTGGTQYTLSANKEVILSAGAFQSPQLLMVSGVGPAASLSKHNIPIIANRPGVGQNMQDHILMGPAYRVNAITGSSLGDPTFYAAAVAQFDNDHSGILTSPGGDFGGWEKLPSHLRTKLSSTTLAALATLPADWPEVEYLSIGGYLGNQEIAGAGPNDGYNYASVAVALEAPLSRGTIDISSADIADPPLINPNWLSNVADQEVAVAGYKRVRELFATKAMAPVLIGGEAFPGASISTDAEILTMIQQSVSTVFHASATCAMGLASDLNAVVDSSAKVIGVSGLRVVDASAFPFLPPGHPMATIYALAEKIAANILAGK